VGIHCVDCVQEGAKSLRTARTPFGGVVTDGRPTITLGLVGICLAVFVAQLAVEDITVRFAFVPVLALDEPWRALTSAFLHSTGMYLHIAFNMYALWLTGPALERLLGRVRFLTLYLVSAVGGSVFVLLLASPHGDSWVTLTVGASGAVFGLFAAMFVLYRRLGRDTSMILGVIVANAVLGFVVQNVAWQAHFGGMVVGAAVAAVFAQRPPSAGHQRPSVKQVTIRHVAGVAAITAALGLLVLVKVAMVGTAAFYG
jgi:membrane associated rhomboid family serine protease